MVPKYSKIKKKHLYYIILLVLFFDFSLCDKYNVLIKYEICVYSIILKVFIVYYK